MILQHFMDLYQVAKKLDLRNVICPTTFSMTKQALSSISKGDIVQIRLNAGEHMENVPSAVLNEGHQVIDIRKDGSSYILYVMRQ